jgi:hypothetical protein
MPRQYVLLIFLTVCLNISTVINIKILTNSYQQTQSYKFTSHITAFLYVVLITEMLEICMQTSYAMHIYIFNPSFNIGMELYGAAYCQDSYE